MSHTCSAFAIWGVVASALFAEVLYRAICYGRLFFVWKAKIPPFWEANLPD
jgi:hypothetical protein